MNEPQIHSVAEDDRTSVLIVPPESQSDRPPPLAVFMQRCGLNTLICRLI